MANRRSPEEILAEKEAQADKLRARVAMNKAKGDKRLNPLNEAIEELNKQEREARKGLGHGPQSFETRRMSHKVWVDEIDAQEAHATALLEHVLEQKRALKTELTDIASALADGKKVTKDRITKAATVAASDSVTELHKAMDDAQQFRKEFNKTKRQPKRTSTTKADNKEAAE